MTYATDGVGSLSIGAVCCPPHSSCANDMLNYSGSVQCILAKTLILSHNATAQMRSCFLGQMTNQIMWVTYLTTSIQDKVISSTEVIPFMIIFNKYLPVWQGHVHTTHWPNPNVHSKPQVLGPCKINILMPSDNAIRLRSLKILYEE